MIPTGHTATYSFFKCIIQLGLFHASPNFINEISLFLYYWEPDVKTNANKERKGKSRSLSKGNKKAKPSKRTLNRLRNPKGSI